MSYGAKEPYHYRLSDVEFCGRALPWKAANLGYWAHPLSLQMIEFEKTS
jgi:hypothetical protein